MMMSVAFVSGFLFTSCGAVDTAKHFAKRSANSMAKLMPSRIPVAEVREKDLKKMPTGADRALAWERKMNKKRFAYTSWKFVPGNYVPPKLPDDQATSSSEGSILPPLKNDR